MRPERFRGWLLAILTLWGIPAFLFWSGVGLSLRLSRERDLTARGKALDRSLTRFSHLAEQALEDRLNAEFERLDGLPAEARGRMLAAFPPGVVRVHLFDRQGRILPDPAEPQGELFQRVFGFVIRSWWDSFPMQEEQFRGLEHLLPGPGRLSRLRDQEGRLRLLGTDEPLSPFHVWGFFRRTRRIGETRIGGLLAFVWPSRLDDGFLLREAVKKAAEPDCHLGFTIESGARMPPEGWSDQAFSDLVNHERMAASPRLIIGSHLVEGRLFRNRSLLLAVTPLPRQSPVWPFLLALGYGVLSLWGQVWLYRLYSRQTVAHLPLGIKLAGLFLFGGVFPLVAAGSVGMLYLEDKREELAAENRRLAFTRLDRLEAGFDKEITRRQLLYRRLVRRFADGSMDLPALQSFCKRLQDAIRLDDFFLVSSQGVLLTADQSRAEPDFRYLLRKPLPERKRYFQAVLQYGRGMPIMAEVDCLAGRIRPADMPHRINPEHQARLHRFLPKVGLEMMQTANLRRHLARPTAAKASDLLLDDLLEEEGRTISNLLKFSLGRLGLASLLSGSGSIFADVLTDGRGEAQFFLLLSQTFFTLQWEYLDRVLAENRRQTADGELRAIGWGRDYSPSYPMEPDDPYQALHEQMARTKAERLVTRMTVGGVEREVIVQKGRSLDGFDLLHSAPAEVVEKRLAPYRNRVLAFLAGTLLFGLLLGWALLQRFLVPLQALAGGVAALSRKEFTHRVRVETGDEWGILCLLLNRTIAHMGEMEMASAVQSTLFPAGPLRLASCEILGQNVMTQAIGGDYYDWFPLPDGRAAVILGDVAGHGLSAALVTAMAKAAFTILCPRFPDDPAAVMNRVNDQFVEILKRAKMMTCILVIVDSGTDSLLLCNAGQSFPLVVDAAGRADFQELISWPLGIRRNVRTARESLCLHGRTVALFSDGLVEAVCPDGQPVGYERFARLVGQALTRTSGSTAIPADPCASILQAVRDLTTPIPWSDDATLVIIRPRGQ